MYIFLRGAYEGNPLPLLLVTDRTVTKKEDDRKVQ